MTTYIADHIGKLGSVVRVQFANDPLYHDDELPEMEDMTFAYCFHRIDEAIHLASSDSEYTSIIFIAHSFSAVITAYYLGIHKAVGGSPHTRYALIEIDNDSSSEALKYLDSLSKESCQDKTVNPFHPEAIAYMRTYSSSDVLKSLCIGHLRIEAKDMEADHEFGDDRLKQVLVTRIQEWLLQHGLFKEV